MNSLQTFWKSTLGKKYVMALTGAGLFLFVIGHMVGNLQFFLPPPYINRYGNFLHSTPELLWPVRLGLLALVGLHILAALTLTLQNRAARPARYAGGKGAYGASLASRTLLLSGLTIAAFIVYHLLHFTLQEPRANFVEGANFEILAEPKTGYHDVFAMITLGFQQPVVAFFYVLSVGLLCLHLGHGVAAMFQSLGLRNAAWGPRIATAARVLSVLIFVGYASIPVSVRFGRGTDYLDRVQTTVQPPASVTPRAPKAPSAVKPAH